MKLKNTSVRSVAVRFVCLFAFNFVTWSQTTAPAPARSAEQRFSEAKQALGSGKLKQGLDLLKELENEGHKLQGLSFQLGTAHYKAGEYSQATPYLRQAIEEEPANKEAVQLLGLSLFRI